MADVARVAGVSITTVSHVVNASRYVAPETRERVRQALESMDYSAPPPVVAPPTGRVIGLAVNGISNAYFAELIQGVETEARRQGFALLLCDSHDDSSIEAAAVATLLAHNVEAVILAPTVGWEETTLPVLRHRATPFVLVDRMSHVRCDQVGAENQAVSAALVEHLIDRGHTRIGILVGLDGLSTTIERRAGYVRAHENAGLTPDPDLVLNGHSTVTGGRSATLRLLRGPKPPTAIYSTNNAMSVGALLAVKAANLKVPDDLAMVAFDDFEWAGAMSPALTAAAQPFHAMGARAVQLLVHRLDDPAAPQRVVRLPVEIEHRESCGCVR
jgi:LacI family transcriptional regulator